MKNFIENYKNKLLFKKFSEVKEIVSKIKEKQKIKDALETGLFSMWTEHNCNYDLKGYCDICEQVTEQGLYPIFTKARRQEAELIYSTKC